MQPSRTFVCAAVLGLSLAGCGAPAGSSPTSLPYAAPAQASAGALRRPGVGAEAAAAGAADALGAAMRTLSEESAAETPAAPAGKGACARGLEFFVPDRAGDPDSAEAEVFYNAACTALARDTVRRYAAVKGGESVNLAVSNYLPGAANAASQRSTAVQFTSGTFTANGFPIVADGFARQATSSLSVGANRRVVESGDEWIVAPANGSTNAVCGDSAGYNGTGIAALGEEFGWAATASGTRTLNADGSVSWSLTHAGTAYSGAIGALSIATGTPNGSCPISAPAYALAGGTALGSATSQIAATYRRGIPIALSASTTARGGYALSLKSNPGVWPTSPAYVTGSIVHGTVTVATLGVDAFGDGTLTLASGKRLVLIDWIVVR